MKPIDGIEISTLHNNWKDDVFKIDINIGNYCNYKCWYCWPGSNSGTHKFPDLETIKTNITHLINYIQANSNKRVFDIHFCGGEPSHWPKLLEFVTYLKENFNVLISMTSNASKKLDWWEKIVPYFDRVHLSCHREYVDLEHFRNVCDMLYERGIVASASVMMDPKAWDECVANAEYLKNSKYRWTIRYVEIIDAEVNYTPEQKKIISQHRARIVHPLWFWWHNKYYINKVTVIDPKGKKHRIQDNELLLKRRNNFYGWECSIGVNWLNINMNGQLGGTCEQTPYGGFEKYNLYDPDFATKFKPNFVPSICSKTKCLCSPEINMPKRNLGVTKKVIPIYEH
jgi:organic radical activating enzyme